MVLWQRCGILVSVAMGVITAPAQADDVSSAYSQVAHTGCENRFEDEPPEAQRAIWERFGAGRQVCPGVAGHVAHFISGDTLIGVGYAAEADRDAVFPLELFDDYAIASRGAVEWRLRGGAVFAVIHRWTIDRAAHPPDYAENGNVLVVSKLTGEAAPSSCVIGYVDAKANPHANALARQVADTIAEAFACGGDVPQYHGEVGPTAAQRRVIN